MPLCMIFLHLPPLTSKEEQLLSVKAMYKGKDVLVCMATNGVWEDPLLSDSPICFDHKLGLIGSEKSSALLVVSLLVFLMVDQVQRL